jgi:hypothetical protein
MIQTLNQCFLVENGCLNGKVLYLSFLSGRKSTNFFDNFTRKQFIFYSKKQFSIFEPRRSVFSAYFEPAGNAHPGFFRRQYFVLHFTAFKKHTFTIFWRNNLTFIIVVNTKFTTVVSLPVRVKVHDHRILPASVVFKLVFMFFIETSCFVKCIMKFVAGYTCVACPVQMSDKIIDQVQKVIFSLVLMVSVQPVDFITPNRFVMHDLRFVARACGNKFVAVVQGNKVFFQVEGE